MTDRDPQRVVCAAMRNEHGEIICGPRHYDGIMRAQLAKDPVAWEDRGQIEQGFVDQYGTFLTREEAHMIAHANNQVFRRCGGDTRRLFSENLY